MIEGLKVVTAEEMARVEKNYADEHDKWMENAGRAVAEAVMELVECHDLPKQVTLLVGKGNNGGDAYAAGVHLLDAGYQVHAYVLYKEASALNKKWQMRFRAKQGRSEQKIEGIVVDGLLGTGFKGKVEEKMATLIRQVNVSGCPVIAVDIPSGLNGTSGAVNDVAIVAQQTVTLGLPKMGLFIRDGWNHVGQLRVADFGLPQEAVDQAEAIAYLPKELKLPKIVRNRHKYEAGYVIGFGGSKKLPGAAKLSSLAALRAGAGIVRLFHPEEIGPVADEVISVKWEAKEWKEALKKAQALFVGPGIGRSPKMASWLKTHLKEIKQHCVIDADALLPGIAFPKMAVLTPHRGEMLRLLEMKALPSEEELFAQVMKFCNHRKVIVVLKGAPTFVFAPQRAPVVIPYGDPGMATAGAGDVLTGVIAALLAQGCSALEGAVLAASLHGLAGEFAALEKTSYCLIASDLIEFLPDAFHYVAETTQ